MSDIAIHAAADLANRPDGKLILATTEGIEGYKVQSVKGLVRGNTIRARHVGHDIMASIKSIFGGEIAEYTKMIAESREQALDRMRAEALIRGANAIIGVRMTTSMILQGSAEIMCYGTAVVLVRDSSETGS